MNNSVLTLLFSQEEIKKLLTSKLLIVGCGGVGCELIKNIIKLGFRDIVLVDNDYVEISNLNRQFYFTRESIKKSKSLSIRDIISQAYPEINLKAYYSDIKEKQFDFEFFSQFSVVFSALDNRQAKEHLSYMCIKNDLPLIIVGVEGFNGQVKTQIRGKSECLFCDQTIKNVDNNETIAICHVKGIPEVSNDCVIWAKALLEDLLFGSQRDILKMRKKINETNEIEIFWVKFFDKIFEINDIVLDNSQNNKIKRLFYCEAHNNFECLLEENRVILSEDEKIHSIAHYTKIFIQNLEYIYKFSQEQEEFLNIITLETKKISLFTNDKQFIDFITAATNLKIHIFKDLKPKLNYLQSFEVKKTVGKIIPAISSANSIVAAIQLQEAINIILMRNSLTNKIDWVSNGVFDKISRSIAGENNSDCTICSWKIIYLRCFVDFQKTTIENIIEILKNFQYFEPDKIFYEGELIIYDYCDKEYLNIYEENLKKYLYQIINNKDLEEIGLKITSRNKKINFEWDLALKNEKCEKIMFYKKEFSDIKKEIKAQLFQYFQQKELKKNKEKFKFLKDIYTIH